MAKPTSFSLPNDKGQFIQPNKSDSLGDIFMTYNIDLDKGRMGVSAQVKKLVNNDDNADFAGYAASIGKYQGAGSDRIFAVSDKAFSADITTPLGSWTEETTGSEPDSGNTIMDSAFFDSLFLVSEATDIKSWDGTTWASWWQTTLGQSALLSGERHLLWVGSDGNLFIVDDGNKVYRVTPTGTVTKTGAGTLDLSATSYMITCAETNSTRSWIGTTSLTGEEAVIIEWDMSPSAATANKLHKINADGVACIAIWNDTPIAILSNGEAKYFNGTTFVEFEREMRFPVPDDQELAEDDGFIHPNGWAIIDDLPHFLVTGRVDNASSLTGSKESAYYMPGGVWCLDPSVGLYHRFALGSGLSTQEDYGKMKFSSVGALFALQRSDSKFLASYEYADDDEIIKSALVYHDAANSQPSRGFLMTTYKYSFREMWKKVELFHKKLTTGEKISVYYRNERADVLGKSGAWASATTFHIVGINLGIEAGDVAFVKMGNGSGQLFQVLSVEESSGTTVVTFTDSNALVAAGDLGTCDFLNFRFMGDITNQTEDYHALTVPVQGKSRKTQFLFAFNQAASNTVELDFAIIST